MMNLNVKLQGDQSRKPTQNDAEHTSIETKGIWLNGERRGEQSGEKWRQIGTHRCEKQQDAESNLVWSKEQRGSRNDKQVKMARETRIWQDKRIDVNDQMSTSGTNRSGRDAAQLRMCVALGTTSRKPSD
eukprot:6191816-Pleurochrysis_carterae.AAC.2